ncbi:MAG: hypothetical protein HYV04_00325 [Deltaproteobacteria bacterium]|nr:hypothetical protein [Deltaproteobacteria bacterium]
MFHGWKIQGLFFVALLSVTPVLTACTPSMVAQAEKAAGAQQKPSGEPAVSVLLGARKVPPPTPGAPPRSPHKTPASYYEPVGPFFFYVETLTSTGPSRYGLLPTVPCVQSGVFKRGMRLVFRFEILDTSTGKRVTDRDGAAVRVRLAHGEELTARWAIRGSAAALPDSAWMWDAAWDIPPDYPVGSLDYAIMVRAKDGRTAAFIPPIQKTATVDSRVRIID